MNLLVNNKKTLIDPVCGMAVVPGIKEIIMTVDRETYYFFGRYIGESFS